jgi:hypothetical protein
MPRPDRYSTPRDFDPPPRQYMCHGCGETYPAKPERCEHCNSTAFERVGGETYLHDIAHAVARAMERGINIDEYGELLMGKRGPKGKVFTAGDLAARIKAAKAKTKTTIFLTTAQASQLYKLLTGEEVA